MIAVICHFNLNLRTAEFQTLENPHEFELIVLDSKISKNSYQKIAKSIV